MRTTGRSILLLMLLFVGKAHATNVLNNPGFESADLGGWTPYGVNTYVNSGTAHGGNYYLKVYQAFTGQINYDGIYQDYISGPGATYSADGWAYSLSSDVLAGQNTAWIEVTFRDVSGNLLALYRSALITTNVLATGAFPENTWVDLAVTNQYDPNTFQITNTTSQLVAPPGTSFMRYQIVFQGDQHNSAGSVYFDDLNLSSSESAFGPQWNIVWSDEFNGNFINTNIWAYDIGGSGWGNNELEYYTSRPQNAYVAGGVLHLVARAESYGGRSFTSARIKSEGLFSWQYGRFQWRAKLPAGAGFWPALWLLGTNITTIGWPGCGEIDVMENNGDIPGTIQGSLHSGSDETGYYYFLAGDAVTNFHTYTLDWETNVIRFYVDGHLYETQTSWSSSFGPYPTPFNQPFFLIMNLAVGGSYVGYPSISNIIAGATFPAEVQVDYVRIYDLTAPLQISVTQSAGNVELTWSSNIVCHLQAQTNSLTDGGWQDIGTTTNSFAVTPDSGNGSVFYRLQSP